MTPRPESALPPALRAKMVALASQGLTKMPPAQVPAPLRKSATFAPAKRAKLVGSQIAQAVDTDQEFRGHLATQVRALTSELVTSLEAGESPSDDQLADAAALAFIVRTEGWREVVESACRAEEQRRTAAPGDVGATIDKLHADLTSARGEVKAVRDKLRGQLDQLKTDNAQLRRTLGQTRVQLKEAQDLGAGARQDVDSLQREAEGAARAAEAEARRLRQRIDQLESEGTSIRRAAHDDRDAENVRLRLLLDTIMEGAAGLRRELALSPADILPADTVPSIEPAAASHTSGVGRALLQDDPALLRRLLELPRVHLIVDGYNVSKTAWPSAPLDQQRARLISGVAALVAGKAIETTIAFDGADLTHPPGVSAPRAIRVRFSPPGVIADDLIRQLVSAEPSGRSIIVVSTDRELAESITKIGARSVASAALVSAMGI